MRVSIDISFYPLKDNYVAPILAFIDRISEDPKLNIVRNSLSTQIFGEYRDVMDALGDEIEHVFSLLPESVFVMKLVGMDREHIVD
ncbi:MAG: YkoF family thiamine/hydroxymethylpyrimidine-binding protein [Methylophagaceae bacterium]